MSPAGGAFTVFLLVQWVTVMSQAMINSSMTDFNMTFPPMPQDFKDVAKKLMTKCSKHGYPPPFMTSFILNSNMTKPEERMENPFFLFPTLLSSFPPLPGNHTPPETNMTMNITEKMWNCTNLLHMISIMRNTSEQAHCFMRAFLAPLSWAAVLQNSSIMSPEQMDLLLWSAKPLLEATLPSPLSLPYRLHKGHLMMMMKLFSEVFSSLSEKQKDEIRQWMKDRFVEIDPDCQPNQNKSKMLPSNSQNPPSAPNNPNPPTDNPNLQTDQTSAVTSGDKALSRARRGLAVGQGLGQENGKVVDPPAVVPNPSNAVNSNKPVNNPGNQINPNKLPELPRNQTTDSGTDRDTSPQTDGSTNQTHMGQNKTEVVIGHGNGNEKMNTIIQSPEEDINGKKVEVGNGNGKNESTGHEVKGSVDKEDDKQSNGPSNGCPRMPWLKSEALRMMGRFLSWMPESDMKAITTDELCKFFQTPEFPYSFTKPDRLQPSIGRMLLQRLKRECFNSDKSLLPQMDKLGSLICFFDEASSLNSSQSKKLLSQLVDCDNSETDQMKRELAKKFMSDSDAPLTRDVLWSLGSSVSVLPPFKLSSFSADDLKDTLTSLKQANWTPAQAKVLTKKLLDKNITGETLLSLGSMVIGVDVEQLRKCQGLQGMLKSEGIKNMTEKMSFLQKMALIEGMRSSLNASDLVKDMPDSLLSAVSVFTLEKAGIVSMDQVEGRRWSRTQSVYILKKVLGEGIKREYVRKLGRAIQGVTCSMVINVNQSDIMEVAQTLTNSSNLLSRTQVSCIAQKLFQTLEMQRAGFFVNISDSELQAIPALLLINLPIKSIQDLPATVCSRFLEKMSQANMSYLPNSSPSRRELRDRALRCLGKNASAFSTAEVLSLGPLVCELDPAWMSTLNTAVLNSTLPALASCSHIPRPYRAPLFKLITSVYGDPSVWSEDVTKLMGPLILLNETALEMMPFKSWLKSALSNLLDRIQNQTSASAPEEFRMWPNPIPLQQKLFQLISRPNLLRRRRAVITVLQPYSSLIEELKEANIYWTPAQLSNMTAQTFRESVQVLGEIRNYTTDQLAVLRAKAIEVWGNVSQLDQPQILELGCISQGFTIKELQSLNITSLDTLTLLSLCQWNNTQIAAVWQSFADRTKMKMADLKAVDMVGLGKFICGLQSDQIDQLNITEFKEALEDVGKEICPSAVLESMKKKATAALGLPKNWGEPEVCMMGNIIAGLNSTELASMKSSVLPFIRQSAIPLISPDRLAALSISQLKALGPDNAAMITNSQRSALGVDQRAAVDEALGVAAPRTETSTSTSAAVPPKGGTAERSLFGIAVLPAVMVLLGFIL